MLRCCCYVWWRTGVVFKIILGNLSGSNIFLRLVSTKDRSSCLIMLHRLLTIGLFCSCVKRRKGIRILNGILIVFEIVFAYQLLHCRRSFIRIVRGMLLRDEGLYHLLLPELHLWSWCDLFWAWRFWIQLLILRWCLLFGIRCWFFLTAWVSWWGWLESFL